MRRARRGRAGGVRAGAGRRAPGLAVGLRAGAARSAGSSRSRSAAGACFDGDVECVGIPSALAWAGAQGFAAIVCAIGPGVVGTASRLGHGGLAVAEAANAASALGGTPVVAVRVSEGDERERHRGVSHHTRTALELCLGDVRVAWPAGLAPPEWLDARDEVDVEGWREACDGLTLDHMGRGPDDDPWFFAAAFAAGRLAGSLVG